LNLDSQPLTDRRERSFHLTTKGLTPVLSSEKATALLTGMDVSTVVGLRDRAIIAVMTYTFARVGAVVALTVEDYFSQENRWWLRPHEKNGKLNEMPCHQKLEDYLDRIHQGRWHCERPQGPLFRSAIGKTAHLTDMPCCAVTCGAWCAVVLRVRESKPR
jgi:integrase/recombinase XerD